MNFNKFQQECIRTANPNMNWKDERLNWALGIAGESGEYCELIKKEFFNGKPLDLEDAKKELGDILYYVAMAANNLHISLDDVADLNVRKLRARYPDGFTLGGGKRSAEEDGDKRVTSYFEAANNDHEDDGN